MNLTFNPDSMKTLESNIAEYINSRNTNTSWLNELQLNELSQFLQQPLPSRKIEHWKYNDLSFLQQANFSVVAESIDSEHQNTVTRLKSELNLTDAIFCVFVNGNYSQKLSNNISNDEISFCEFSDANQQQSKIMAESINSTRQNKNLFIQLNNALSSDGLLIEIANNKKIENPIILLQISDLKNKDLISTNQIIVNCNKKSESQILEIMINADSVEKDKDSKSLALQQTIINLQDNSQCHHYRLNNENQSQQQISRTVARLQKHARLSSFYYSHGSKLNRTDIDVYHQGQQSESNLTGIYLPSNENCIDYHTNLEHQVAHCDSREIFRGIIADKAKATFAGKIHIFRNAQKSDAQLSNKNLLLTNQAEINTKPELEIYADDVVCAHGATVAKIDNKAVYYLQTRGINKTRAKKMLSVGFINELLDKIKNDSIKKFVQQQVQSSLSDV